MCDRAGASLGRCCTNLSRVGFWVGTGLIHMHINSVSNCSVLLSSAQDTGCMDDGLLLYKPEESEFLGWYWSKFKA